MHLEGHRDNWLAKTVKAGHCLPFLGQIQLATTCTVLSATARAETASCKVLQGYEAAAAHLILAECCLLAQVRTQALCHTAFITAAMQSSRIV